MQTRFELLESLWWDVFIAKSLKFFANFVIGEVNVVHFAQIDNQIDNLSKQTSILTKTNESNKQK